MLELFALRHLWVEKETAHPDDALAPTEDDAAEKLTAAPSSIRVCARFRPTRPIDQQQMEDLSENTTKAPHEKSCRLTVCYIF